MRSLRLLYAQTRMDFVWYFARDGEMIFWSLAFPIFFLFVFSFALGSGSTRTTSTFLVPGLIGAMLATFREKKVLRRIYLTPLPAWIFFTALVLYRMALLAFQAVLLAVVGALVFKVRVIGNPFEILTILALGATTFVSLGAVVGALVRSTESANNVASVLTVPLAFVSDAYFPIDRFPSSVAAALRMLPSTEFVDALRGIAMYGDSLAHYTTWIIVLALWAVAGTAVTARYFRWV
jgi:ABC-2 type transport system permease protein